MHSPPVARREIYKSRVIEVCPAGSGKVRAWHAFVDRFSVTYSRYGGEPMTSSYKTSMAAARAAREDVDRDISYQSWLRRTDPLKAVEQTRRRFEAAQKWLADAREQLAFWEERFGADGRHTVLAARQRVEDAELRYRRTRADLETAERAMAAQNVSSPPALPAQPSECQPIKPSELQE